MGSPPARALSSTQVSSPWDVSTKRTVLIILLIGLIFVVWLSRPVLPPIIVGAIIAYILGPVVDLGERVRIPRTITTIVLFVLLLVGVILLPVFLVPILLGQLATLSNFDVPGISRALLAWFNSTFYSLPDVVVLFGFDVPLGQFVRSAQSNYQEFQFPTVAEILSYIQQVIQAATTVVSGTAVIGFTVVGGIFQILLSFIITFFMSLYMTKDAPRIRAYIQSLFPTSYQSELLDLLRRMGSIWQAFFRGQIVLSIVIGITIWGVLTLVGMPGALILGLIAGIMESIPNVGPILAMIPAVIIALLQGSDVLQPLGINNFGFALITVGIYFVVQQLENHILVPRIIGHSVNLHPIIVIAGVFIGFNVGGILGALLAAPAIATLRVLGSYVHAKLLDYTPFLSQELPRRRRTQYRRRVKGAELTAPRPAGSSGAHQDGEVTGQPTVAALPIAMTETPDAGNGRSDRAQSAAEGTRTTAVT